MTISILKGTALLYAMGAMLPYALALPQPIGGPIIIPPNKNQPVARLPQKATANDLKFQPILDYDTDGCYNVAAIDSNGATTKGLNREGGAEGCREEKDMDNSNAYSRQRCNNGWCFYLYDYYFERDSAGNMGHTHDWEHIGVWVQNGRAEYIAASAHGKYNIKKRADVLMDGERPKMVYHKDGGSTHAFRFGSGADNAGIENHKKQWWASPLVSYNGYPAGVREKLFGTNWGSASIAIKDGSFADNINKAKPSEIKNFDANKDDGSPGVP